MKVKEINTTANIVWSPSNVTPAYLACGTSAQQLDASFNTSSVIQLYNLNLNDTSLDMKLAGSHSVPVKFHQLLWKGSSQGMLGQPSGVLVGGCDNGAINIYSPDKLLKKEEPLILSLEGKHSGPVQALDFNYHQDNLLASGASNCEIFIWDINDKSAPMTPGAKPNLTADVSSIGWNRQVEHIMAATYGGRCVVYDLRKGASIIQISESVSQIRSHKVNWHPSIATRLIVSSNDDTTPVSQIWDLRYAASPVSTLEGHQRGIATSQWCSEDPDLFITCGKDNRILVWNPNTNIKGGEIVGEFPAYNQWSFDMAWCPKDPSLVATATIDSYVSVYSLLGAGSPPNQSSKFSAIADSFPGMEMPSEIPQAPTTQPIQLKRPPKWFARRSGASFGFGGRLISWNSESTQVQISQVVTEPEFVSKSDNLEAILGQADLKMYCQEKSQEASAENDRSLWSFLGATFDLSTRSEFSSLLGFPGDVVAKRVRPHTIGVDVQQLVDKMSDLPLESNTASTGSLDPTEQFEMIASTNSANKTPEVMEVPDMVSSQKLSLATGDEPEGLLRHALLLGDFESGVEICLKESNHSLALILAAEAGGDLFEKTKERVLQHKCQNDALITMILKKRLNEIVASCKLSEWKAALVALLTYAHEQEMHMLAETLGQRLESSGQVQYLQAALLCFICAGNVDQFASCFKKVKPNVDKSSKDLQDLVELLVILLRALKSCGRTVSLDVKGATNRILSQYASLLASQGALSRAMSYLGGDVQGDVALLKERIQKSLGQSNSASNRNRLVSTSSQHSMRRTSTPHSYQNQQPQHHIPPIPSQPQAPNFFVPPIPAPMQMKPSGQMATGFSSFQQHTAPAQSFGNFQPVSPAPMPPAGPPPTEAASATFGARKNGPSRYVTAAPAPSNMWSPPCPTNPASVPSAYTQTSFAPPAAGPYQPSIPGGYSSQGFHQPPSSADAQGAHLPPPPPAAFDPNVPRGWNDPPPVSASRKLAGGHAVVGPILGEHSGAKRLSSLKAKQQKTPVSSGIPANIMQPNEPAMSHQFMPAAPAGFNPTRTTATHQQPVPVAQPVKREPIPSEHQVLQDVFDGLRNKGLASAINPAAKQRLGDLGPKLELLYDKLRRRMIEPTTTDGLHQIAALIKSGDYHQALVTHSTTVSSGNFAEITSFMPALKLLLSTCMQCQIFL